METKTIIERYAKYYEYLQKLGTFPLRDVVTLEMLGLPKGMIQSGYKEMEGSFKGSLIYYLCYVSTLYLIDLARKKNPTSVKTAEIICNNFSAYKADTANLLRLFNVNPEMVIETIIDKEQHRNAEGMLVYDEEYAIEEYKIYMILSSAWFMIKGGIMVNEKPVDKLYDESYSDDMKMYKLIKQLIDS